MTSITESSTTITGETAAVVSPLRALAIYLPQYHPVAENDEWWGPGFTEWTNVTRARPQFPGHYQPHVPADMGFYDLRVPEVRFAQAEMAKKYGIHGFCYYHYWFSGRRILERPFTEVLNSGEPDFPFLLCWANENWTRRWDGHDREVLLHQEYSAEDDIAHIRSLFPVFADPRYIRIDGKPVFMVYRTSLLPEPKRTVERWREEAHRAGIGELYLIRVESHWRNPRPEELGFDAAMPFAPDWHILPPSRRPPAHERILRRLGLHEPYFERQIVVPYAGLAEAMLAQKNQGYLRYPCVTPMWDNSARRKGRGAAIFDGSTPELYRAWLETAVARFTPPSQDENLIFINAWNEWAEGNHLEPCERWGHAYLEATRDVLRSAALVNAR
jgi:lipopolysaccharide biosynthesis protein